VFIQEGNNKMWFRGSPTGTWAEITTPTGVSQRANLSSTTAANSINATAIGVTGTLPIGNGGTGKTNETLAHTTEITANGAYTLPSGSNARCFYFVARNGNYPYIDTTNNANIDVIRTWIPGTPFISFLVNENSGNGTPLPSRDAVIFASTVSMLKQGAYDGRDRTNWSFKWTGSGNNYVGENTMTTYIYIGNHGLLLNNVNKQYCVFARICQ
jgi:hypothetical protein